MMSPIGRGKRGHHKGGARRTSGSTGALTIALPEQARRNASKDDFYLLTLLLP